MPLDDRHAIALGTEHGIVATVGGERDRPRHRPRVRARSSPTHPGRLPAAARPGTRRAPGLRTPDGSAIHWRSVSSHGNASVSWTPIAPPMTTTPPRSAGRGKESPRSRRTTGRRHRRRSSTSASRPGPSCGACWATTQGAPRAGPEPARSSRGTGSSGGGDDLEQLGQCGPLRGPRRVPPPCTQVRMRSSSHSPSPTWLRWRRSAAILRSKVSVMSTARLALRAAIIQISATVCGSRPSSRSSGWAKGFRASG